MNRRATIKSLGMISLHSFYPSVLASFLASCHSGTTDNKGFTFFSPEEQPVIVHLMDILIPRTNTRSASEVKVQYFIDEVFSVCLDNEQQTVMKNAIAKLTLKWNEASDKMSLVKELDERAFKDEKDYAWFKTFKQLTMIGFFTSEEGSTKAGDYQKIPDRFIGEEASDDETLAHAKTALRYNV